MRATSLGVVEWRARGGGLEAARASCGYVDAMLTALFKEGKIIYTGEKKHQLALETIWWLCLFYFPAFRTRWQQDEQCLCCAASHC